MLVFLLIVIGIVYYFASPEERQRAFRKALGLAERLRDAAIRARERSDPFSDALRERTRWPIVTPALLALNVLVFLRMSFGDGFGDPEALVAWGASFGPRTTNGEWWRLASAMFVQGGMFHLLINMAGLVQIGLLLERLVGHLTVAIVYMAAGLLAGLVSLSSHPVAVTFGATPAVLSLYGLFTATLVWITLQGSTLTVPVSTLKRLAPAAGVFVLYAALSDGPQRAGYLPGLFSGFVCGLVLARGVGERKPPVRRAAAVTAIALVVLTASAMPLRGVADVRPEIARVVDLEDRTSRAYKAAVDQFKLGAMTAEALAQVINRTIMPELQAARSRLKALAGVPPEHQPLVAHADEYLRLRDESWRLRADGLHQANMLTLRKAESAERQSLEAFERIRPVEEK
jgi:membrane associated rhomboid family serine protease